jgi:hypothetical protein
MRQIGCALHDYNDTFGAFPSGTVPLSGVPPERRLSWLATVQPFIESGPLVLDPFSPCDVGLNALAMRTFHRVFSCPGITGRAAEDSPGLTQYVGVAGIGTDAADLSLSRPEAGFFGYDRRLTTADIKDGLGCTLAVIETEMANGSWVRGGRDTVRGLDARDRPYIRLGGPSGVKHLADSIFQTHPVLANVAFADASVRSLNSSISANVIESLATVAGGETIDDSY